MHGANYHGVNFIFTSMEGGEIEIAYKGKEIKIPAKAILELVAYEYVAMEKIIKIEDMDATDLLLS